MPDEIWVKFLDYHIILFQSGKYISLICKVTIVKFAKSRLRQHYTNKTKEQNQKGWTEGNKHKIYSFNISILISVHLDCTIQFINPLHSKSYQHNIQETPYMFV